MSVLDLTYNFSTLSIRDLLEAREAYHYHLLSKPNVIGTAVGLYLIRDGDPAPAAESGNRESRSAEPQPARTLLNSNVRDYSWPCILAFVRKWEAESEFGAGRNYSPAQIVPKTLFLPDGRAVPVCVVQADEMPAEGAEAASPHNPSPIFKFGGGMPLAVDIQGTHRFATAGCLVTDGHLTYALTARHVCGKAGSAISGYLRDGVKEIGVSSDLQLTRIPFATAYPDFAGEHSYLCLDIGLVELHHLDDWTSNTYGLPPVGQIADLHDHNVSLRLIDQPLIGVGAASGLLQGKIKALFYRYRSVGGYDYVSDFLIAPVGETHTRPGDSGMVWHLDVSERKSPAEDVPLQQRDLRPLAIEWGGQVLGDSGQRTVFAVATSLSNACKLLDVELVTDLSKGVSGYWGRNGHYTIARYAIDLIQDATLKAWFKKNTEILSFELDKLAEAGFDKTVGQMSAADDFVPLADVPDEIWKQLPFGKRAREGGRDTQAMKTGSDGPEHPNHYADIDAPFGPAGETWRAMCLAHDKNLSVEAWTTYYDRMAQKANADGDTEAAAQYKKEFKRGILPFRVWQFYDAMVAFAANEDALSFLTAAGIVAHYYGDSCQPLHGSIYADGDRSRTVERQHPRLGTTETVIYGKGVHSAYETAMISAKASDLQDGINQKLAAFHNGHGLPLCASGRQIARAVVKVMDDAAAILEPMTILDSFENAGAGAGAATLNAMWEDLGDRTAEVMVLGIRGLAMLWDSAWKEGNGAAMPKASLTNLDPSEVRSTYIDKAFVPSLTLSTIGTVLK